VKKLLLVALIAAGATYGAPAAQAHCHTTVPPTGDPNCLLSPNYAGPGCSFATLNDTTGQLGGQNTWNGEIDVLVIATDGVGAPTPTVPISVDCEMLINGVSQGVVLHAEGIGIAANAKDFSFTAEETDVVTICDHVNVGGTDYTNCADATTTELIPQPVQDALLMLDPAICMVLMELYNAGVTGVPGVVEMEPEGDIFVLGEPQWDCPPYDHFPPD
jgi:hypothetical protein